VVLDDPGHLLRARVDAHQQQGAVVETATPNVPGQKSERELFGEQEGQVDGAKQDEKRS